jgi:hypothetical protein
MKSNFVNYLVEVLVAEIVAYVVRRIQNKGK